MMSSQILEILLDSLNIAVLLEDKDRKIVSVNTDFMSVFHLPSDAKDYIIGIDCMDAALAAKHMFKHKELFLKDVINIPNNHTEHITVVDTSDNRKLKRCYKRLVINSDECYHLWTYEDVTKLLMQEEALKNQKDFFEGIINQLPADIAIFSADHKYLFVNESAIKNSELRRWMVGKDDFDYCKRKGINDNIAQIRRGYFNQAVDAKVPVSWVDTYKHDGIDSHVLRIMYPVFDDQYKLKHVIGYGVDVTDEKKYEIELARQKERFESFILTLNEGVLLQEPNGNVLLHNSAFNKILGLSPNKIIKNIDEIFNVKEDEKIYLNKLYNKINKTKGLQTGSFKLNIKDEQRHVKITLWSFSDHANRNFVATILNDITEVENYHKFLEDLVEKERSLSKQKSQFIRITSHELRTPLTIIRSSVDLANYSKHVSGDPELLDLNNTIIRQVEEISELLNSLLIAEQINNGGAELKFQSIEIKSYLLSILNSLFIPYKDGRSLLVKIVNIDAIVVDPKLLKHAIINLVENAFKYSPKKASPILKVEQQNEEIVFTIQDFGVGIPDSDISNIFNSFYRGSNVKNITGTGIGLMVAKYAIERHQGKLYVEKTDENGTVFKFNIKKFSL